MTAASSTSESWRTTIVPAMPAECLARMRSRSALRLRISFEAISSSFRLPLPVRQELSVVRELHAVALRVGDGVDVDLEVDRAHDAVAELLVDHRLDGRPVDLGDLVEAVDERVDRDRGFQGPLRRRLLERRHHVEPLATLQTEQVHNGLRLRGIHRGLAHQGRGRPDGVAAQLVGDLLVRETAAHAGLPQRARAILPLHVGCPSRALPGGIVGDCATGSRSNQRIRSLNRTTSPTTTTLGAPSPAASVRPGSSESCAVTTRCRGSVPFSTTAAGVLGSHPPARSSFTMTGSAADPIRTTIVSAEAASPRQFTALPWAVWPVTMATEEAYRRSVTGIPA